MNSFKTTTLAAAVALALGTTGVSTTASAVAIADGLYTMSINITPELVPGTGIPDVGADGAWNSSFTFTATPSVTASQGMFDNDTLVSGFGSGVLGDGFAGNLGMTVTGGNLSFTSFSVDTIAGTAGGNFAQEGGTLAFTGTTTDTVTSFDPTGRLGAIDGAAGFVGVKWDYAAFTTGASTNTSGTVNGTAVANVGDVNGDGLDDYTATLVSAGVIGPEWGSFEGFNYFEIYNVAINSVPVPAAVWLFGSGLIGLAGIARRRKTRAA